MTKNVKRGVVDRYLNKHPNATAKTISEATGCHVATVYSARKRLGIPKYFRNRMTPKSLPANPPLAEFKQVPLQEVDAVMLRHQREITRLRGNYAIAKAAIFGLSAIVVACLGVLVFNS